jgi:hypothetical protein
MPFDVRKTLSDTAYVTIGLGVLGFQQTQVRRRELQQRLADGGGCLGSRARHGRARLGSIQHDLDGLAQDLRGRFESGARSATDWAQEIGGTVRDRIEPVVDQVVEQALRVQTVITTAA